MMAKKIPPSFFNRFGNAETGPARRGRRKHKSVFAPPLAWRGGVAIVEKNGTVFRKESGAEPRWVRASATSPDPFKCKRLLVIQAK
jgi:hypothetical protein